MYYNMVLIETHDNELLSNSIPRDSSGKILSSNFVTIKNVFLNCSLFSKIIVNTTIIVCSFIFDIESIFNEE